MTFYRSINLAIPYLLLVKFQDLQQYDGGFCKIAVVWR
jgi:hypothetical protein